jgi:RNA polymerase sigma-70 factor (ECF subfamily)
MLGNETRIRSLMVEAQAGDTNSARKLLDALRGPLERLFANRLFSTDSDAEDLAQETLLAIFTHRTKYDPSRSLNSWCYTVARHKLIDHLRRLSRTPGEPLDDEVDPLAHHRIEDGVMRWDLSRVLTHLTPRQRSVLHDVRVLGFTISEAARRHGTTETAAKVMIHRSMKALRKRLEGQVSPELSHPPIAANWPVGKGQIAPSVSAVCSR